MISWGALKVLSLFLFLFFFCSFLEKTETSSSIFLVRIHKYCCWSSTSSAAAISALLSGPETNWNQASPLLVRGMQKLTYIHLQVVQKRVTKGNTMTGDGLPLEGVTLNSLWLQESTSCVPHRNIFRNFCQNRKICSFCCYLQWASV